jgi:hypothetical protein
MVIFGRCGALNELRSRHQRLEKVGDSNALFGATSSEDVGIAVYFA